MRITIEDFKGIAKVEDFRLEQISVLAGTNSGGKSSLIQLIMLLKQSLEARSPEAPLKLNRPYVSLGRFEALTRRSAGVKGFKTTIILEKHDLGSRLIDFLSGKRRLLGAEFPPVEDLTEVRITAEFKKPTNKIVVSNFELHVIGRKTLLLHIVRNSHGKSHAIHTNAFGLFFRTIRVRGHELIEENTPKNLQTTPTYEGKVGYTAFFPTDLDIESDNGSFISFSPILNIVRNSLYAAFEQISYIGPLREEPREFYYHDDDLIDHIGNKGENAAFLLAKHADDQVEYTRFGSPSDPDRVELKKGTLKQAVNYWLCDVFDLAREVKVDRAKTNRYLYAVSLKGKDGSVIPITHVGFGISQIFPILVEGLRASQTRRLIILEQPEIHLHPKVQSWLFDFIRTVPGASFLVETHSDHFVNRLRRRVAEDTSGSLLRSINLSFVNATQIGTTYERLKLEDSGSLMRWPVGFFDQYEEDMRAIVRAQASKRRQTRG